MKLQQLIEKTKAELAKLESKQNAALQRLVKEAGYGEVTREVLIEALQSPTLLSVAPPAKKARKARAVVTPATRKAVGRLSGLGETDVAIAKRLDLATSTVQRIKRGEAS